jgi:GGDEF domain-containing protein
VAAKPKQTDAPPLRTDAVEALERFIDSMVAAATAEQCRAGIVVYMDQDNTKQLNEPGVRDELLRRYRESWATADVVTCLSRAGGLEMVGVLLRNTTDASKARVRIEDVAAPLRWPVPPRSPRPFTWDAVYPHVHGSGSAPDWPRKRLVIY